MTDVLSQIGDLPVEQFMNEDWHTRPRLFRQAFPNFQPICDLETIEEMASDPDIESRIIRHNKKQWTVEHGPFDSLPGTDESNWTVLIQGIDHHLPEAYDLLAQFRFIPDARVDDLMLSFASDGGGVGPHYDSYDVFLLQMHGTRKWRIGPIGDGQLVEGSPLKLLKNFEPEEEFVLEPGDMLYLPPNYGHDGVAVGPCSTLSIGFRALSHAETLSTLLHDLADRIQEDATLKSKLFSDPCRGLQKDPAEIPQDLIEFTHALFDQWKPDSEDFIVSLGKMLTDPKPIVYYESDTDSLSGDDIKQILSERGIALSMKTRMLVHGDLVFINGDCIKPKQEDTKVLLRKLANERQFQPKLVNSALVNEEFAYFVIGFAKVGWIETLV